MRSRIGKPDEASRLAIGDRVWMSAFGRERHPKYGDRQGVIVGQGSPSSWRVKFDDRKCVQAIHRDYLEPAPVTNALRRSARKADALT